MMTWSVTRRIAATGLRISARLNADRTRQLGEAAARLTGQRNGMFDRLPGQSAASFAIPRLRSGGLAVCGKPITYLPALARTGLARCQTTHPIGVTSWALRK